MIGLLVAEGWTRADAESAARARFGSPKQTVFRAVVDRIEGDMLVLELTDDSGIQHLVDVPTAAVPDAREGDVFTVQFLRGGELSLGRRKNVSS
jgi:hypothetical protein